MTSDDCVFCEIAEGRAQASRLYDGPGTLAFLDITPATPGHLLVVPKAHASCLAELPPDAGAQMFEVAQRMAATLRASDLRCEGVNLWLADGEAAGQRVFHVHLHVLPRFAGDGFRLRADFGQPSRDELDAQAAALRAVLDRP
jgi:histidine triad (HIT) family protein